MATFGQGPEEFLYKYPELFGIRRSNLHVGVVEMRIYICKCGHEEEINESINTQFKECRKCKRIGQWRLSGWAPKEK